MLEPLGFVVLAASERPGLPRLGGRDVRPDLFLLDISMPGMSGWELARALREAGHAKARIVMLSANVGETAPARGEDDAHDDALPKPFDLAQLLDRIGRLLRLEWTAEADARRGDRAAGGRPRGCRPRATSTSCCASAGSAMCAASRPSSPSSMPSPASGASSREMRGHLRPLRLRALLTACSESDRQRWLSAPRRPRHRPRRRRFARHARPPHRGAGALRASPCWSRRRATQALGTVGADHPRCHPDGRADARHGRLRDQPPPQGQAAVAHVPIIFMTGLTRDRAHRRGARRPAASTT